jgi:hypothetical protein
MKAQAFELELAAGPLRLLLERGLRNAGRGSRCNSPNWHVPATERPGGAAKCKLTYISVHSEAYASPSWSMEQAEIGRLQPENV